MDLLDVLLMRVLDGEASDEERARLLELGDAEERLARLEALRAELKSSLEVDDIDLSDDIMAALSPGLAPVEDELVTEDLGLELRLSAMVDGELSGEERLAMGEHLASNPDDVDQMTAIADMGRQLREALRLDTKNDEVELWGAVAEKIGIEDPEHVPGWEPAAEILREALAEEAALSAADEGKLTAAIMNALPRPEPLPEPVTEEESAVVGGWRQIFLSPALPALAALCIAVILLGRVFVNEEVVESIPEAEVAMAVEAPEDVDTATADDVYAMVHDAEVEELEMDDDVLVQVIQMDEGAPLFLMIDEGDEGATL